MTWALPSGAFPALPGQEAGGDEHGVEGLLHEAGRAAGGHRSTYAIERRPRSRCQAR